jgi:hypothetical protein
MILALGASVIYVTTLTIFGNDGLLSVLDQSGIETFGIIADVIVGGFLAYLYWRTLRSQKRQESLSKDLVKFTETQTRIEEHRQRIDEVEHEPEVAAQIDSVSNGTIHIKCENRGSGIAKNLRVNAECFVSQDSFENRHRYDGIEMKLLSDISYSDNTPKSRESSVRYWLNNAQISRANSELASPDVSAPERLKGGESDYFEFSLNFSKHVDLYTPSRNSISFVKAVDELHEHRDVGTIGFRIKLVYDDLFGDKAHEKPLKNTWIRPAYDDIDDVFSDDVRGIAEMTARPGLNIEKQFRAYYR